MRCRWVFQADRNHVSRLSYTPTVEPLADELRATIHPDRLGITELCGTPFQRPDNIASSIAFSNIEHRRLAGGGDRLDFQEIQAHPAVKT